MSLLDEILDAPKIISEQHDVNRINFVAGLSDPGEMIRCGYLPELRRLSGELDEVYAARILPLVLALPEHERQIIMDAAIRRASLDTSNGRVAVMAVIGSKGELPWHALGVVINKAANSEQAIVLSGQNFRVAKIPAYYNWQGDYVQDDEVYYLIREDTGKKLSAVGSRYQVIQNTEAFAFMDEVLKEYGAKYDTAGSLYGGKRVWLSAYLPDKTFSVNGKDEQQLYALFTNPHEIGKAHCYPTTTRTLCANTYRLSTSDQDHGKFQKNYRGTNETKLSRRFESVISGDGDDLKQTAYEKALALSA